jgi:hypothetical protein
MYESRVLKTLPTYISSQFPFIITWRSGIDISFLKTVITNSQSAMGIASSVAELRERMKYTYFQAMESFYSRVVSLKKIGVTPHILATDTRLRNLIEEATEFVGMDSFFGGPLPTERLIQAALELLAAKNVLSISGEGEQGYTREAHQHLLMQTIQGLFLKGDATYRFARLTIVRSTAFSRDTASVSAIGCLYTILNEIGQVVWNSPLVSDSLYDKFDEIVQMLVKRYAGRGYGFPIVYWSDTCCAGSGFWADVFEKVSKLTGSPIRLESSPGFLEGENLSELDTLKLPEGRIPLYISTTCDISVIFELLKDSARLPENTTRGNRIIGLDIEYQPFTAGIPATLQLCTVEGVNIIMHFDRLDAQGLVLVQNLLSDPEFVFVGVGIKGDCKRLLHRDVVVTNTVDCAERAKKNLLIPQERAKGSATLDGLCRHLLKKSLPKDPAVRLSNWKNPLLSPKQIEYAVLDAFAGASLYKYILQNVNGYSFMN